MGLISCLVLIEPDMGTAVLLFIIGMVLCLIAGMKLRHFALMCPFGLTILLYEIFKNKHQLDRIMVYFDFLLNPHIIRHDAGYHVSQSLLTIGSGGIMGLGLGKGMQKFGYLPDCHTDFIFAIICEELGMIGAVAILLIFGFLIWQGVRVALFSSELFASLLAAGVTAMIAAQVAINMGMATSLLPAKGMPLPFISYGGSSVLFMLIAVGILLNVSQYMPENREKQLIKRMGFNETFK
jgi:cell division protein FtsW